MPLNYRPLNSASSEIRMIQLLTCPPPAQACYASHRKHALRNERFRMRPPPSIFALSENSRLVTRLRVPLAPCCGPGDVEARGGVCLKRSGAREACCGIDIQEVWRCAAGVLPLCLKSSGDALQACICGGTELWSSGGGVETCRRYRGMELWRCTAGVWT